MTLIEHETLQLRIRVSSDIAKYLYRSATESLPEVAKAYKDHVELLRKTLEILNAAEPKS